MIMQVYETIGDIMQYRRTNDNNLWRVEVDRIPVHTLRQGAALRLLHVQIRFIKGDAVSTRGMVGLPSVSSKT